jgi:hypothetical protein
VGTDGFCSEAEFSFSMAKFYSSVNSEVDDGAQRSEFLTWSGLIKCVV